MNQVVKDPTSVAFQAMAHDFGNINQNTENNYTFTFTNTGDKPLIIETVHYKKLMDHPNERSSHSEITPTLAGVAFFGSLIISIFFIHYIFEKDISFHIIAALTVLFFLGLKDDLMVLSSKTKVFSQTVAIVFILVCPELIDLDYHPLYV